MEDREIIERIIGGDSKLFSIIADRYASAIYSKVLSLVRRGDLAQEVTQQAFIRVYTRLGDWRGERLGAWITAIAMHLALNALDKERRRRTEDINERVQAQDEAYSEEHEMLLRRMEKAIGALPDNDRKIVHMHYYEKRKADDIARKLGMTKSNVLVRLHRIREQLRKQLEDENDE